MAKTPAFWGIEVGQSALRALRCSATPDPDRLEADAFDYIEYPQLLSEPGASAEQLVGDALNQFLSRNSVRGDRIGITVSGQLGLARFIKLPPVETSKIPDIVKYEARQQIPFPLETVVWDYQELLGGAGDGKIALDTEVGLFAMKREQVYKVLETFTKAKIEVDVVQLTPLALFNCVAFDRLGNPPKEKYDPENPPENLVILSMGCETTDMVITNGFRVWQRSIPVGGNHFTKALMKEFNLTFGKAEHLKKNATTSSDPKAVFQAMKPVFADLVSQCSMSLNFFRNLDRNAEFKSILALGGVMKLPGIRTYLSQHLEMEIEKFDRFEKLGGDQVVRSQRFVDNILGFGPCYGLCLQGLKEPKIRTNLIPPELVQDRLIRAKKPWAVAAAAALMMGLAANSLGYWGAWRTVHETVFQDAVGKADGAVNLAAAGRKGFEEARDATFKVQGIGKQLVANNEGRLYWMEIFQAVDACLPRDAGEKLPKPEGMDEEEFWWENIKRKNQIYIRRIEAEYCEKLEDWYAAAKKSATGGAAGAAGGAAPGTEPAPGAPPADPNAVVEATPKGPGWIIQITGHHFHNPVQDTFNNGLNFVNRNFLVKLRQPNILLVNPETGSGGTYPIGDIGIQTPMIVRSTPINWEHTQLDEKTYEPYPFTASGGGGAFGGGSPYGGGMGGSSGGFGGTPTMPLGGAEGYNPSGGMGGPPGYPPGGLQPGAVSATGPGARPKTATEKAIALARFDFQLQFCWQETPRAVRDAVRARREEERKKKLEEQQKAQQNGGVPSAAANDAGRLR